MSGQGPNDRLGRVIETAVYAPLGLGLYLKELAPGMVAMLVARGRAEIDRRQDQASSRVRSARSIGQVAVAFGVPELRRRVGEQLDAARDRAEGVVGAISLLVPSTPAPPMPPPARPTPSPAPAGDARGSGAASAHLPIPGYDNLSASQVVERLAGLRSDELAAVSDYERAHRNRRTILGKVEQLSE